MDTQRLVLFVIFAMSGVMLWDAWQKHNAPPKPANAAITAPAQPSGKGPAKGKDVPTTSAPNASAGVPVAQTATTNAAAAVPTLAAGAAGELIDIETDLFYAKVSTTGGVITEIAFKEHKDTDDKTKPYLLLQNNAKRFALAQAGLLGGEFPKHNSPYVVQAGARKLEAGKDTLALVLKAETPTGPVTQTLNFKRGSYAIEVAFDIANTSNTPLQPTAYFQLARDTVVHQLGGGMGVTTYAGPAIYTEDKKFVKVDFDEIKKLDTDKNRKVPFTEKADNGWAAMVEQYFVAAWLPADKTAREYYVSKIDDKKYAVGAKLPMAAIAPGAAGKVSVPLYVGPQEQDKLAVASNGLELVVDYGRFDIVATPMFKALKFFHSLVANWGWAIVLLTICIKAIFYPLNERAGRSMGKMKLVGPKLKQIQEQYANDRVKLNQAMMELYKKEKINPMGGCLPILVQIPVFISLYWVLVAAVELRGAPWIAWIKDLSAPDPWYILPVIYAITAWIQVKIQPPSPGMDPMQQKIFQWMPVAFAVMFIFFPAGLVLYWTVSNILQIAQQWNINRVLEKEKVAADLARR
jgi:YidC/Oxa1 family membrane protein insertase